MSRMNSGWVAALALALAACSGDEAGKSTEDTEVEAPTPVGMWAVRKQTRNADSCESPGDELLPIPFVDLRMNGSTLEFYVCRTEEDCDEVPDSEWSMQLVDGFWEGYSYNGSISEQEGACRLFRQERFLDLEDDKLSLERLDYVAYIENLSDEDDCIAEAADWSGSGGTCGPYETIKADRVGAASE